MGCPGCGAENEAGRKFCGECGTALALACPACGTANSPGVKFCGECGGPIGGGPAPAGQADPAPETERRLVSVLFADLVGFTTLAEGRDPEDVRELLGRYFDIARGVVARYGGTVEKFIGDAVMALWGAPIAQEDDAERAVRAALELTAAVAALGTEIGGPGLQARVGVLTGEAAVSVGAQGQGLVSGDLVNTASRVQSAAEPGGVLVGEATRRATEAIIAYEDAGVFELKGKAEPVRLWLAARVVAARGGSLRAAGLEAPFVGRDRELRLMKELFHATAEDRKAQLVSVVGIAGIGKSRLAWEFFKYLDGVVEEVFWHRGRCLAYGDGVTYWALAEMVRSRAGIEESEDPVTARSKLHAMVEEHLADPEERQWVEPRLAQLIGAEEAPARPREDLFGAWRKFFERLAAAHPTVLLFEDVQWADAALIGFVEHLLDWSRSHPIFVVVLARPEVTERHPGFASGQRNVSTFHLEPLARQAMSDLLDGLAPGLPDDVTASILDRAEGVPLYAVETLRMLIDRGLLARGDGHYDPIGPLEALAVPETLHALVAARLDGLSGAERALVHDLSVLGKTFTREAAAALGGLTAAELDELLTCLVRKEILDLQRDVRSPEQGQYGFLQDLVRQVAYETLARRERKTRHLRAAAYLETLGADDLVEVVASHYVDAYRADPEAADADEIRAQARDVLTRAGERTASLAAPTDAGRYFEQAAELATQAGEQGALYERAGQMAWTAGETDAARAHFNAAISLLESVGETHAAARVTARRAEVDWRDGHLDEAVDAMEAALATLGDDAPDEDLAALAAQLGRLHIFRGDLERAGQRIDWAVGVAESLMLSEVLSQALNTAGIIALNRGRAETATALIGHALTLALEADLPQAALRAHWNLGVCADRRDRTQAVLDQRQRALDLARRVGDRRSEWQNLSSIASILADLGRWDEALAQVAAIPREQVTTLVADFVGVIIGIGVARGDLDEARGALSLIAGYRASADIRDRMTFARHESRILRAAGRPAEALSMAQAVVEDTARHETDPAQRCQLLCEAAEAALAIGDLRCATAFLSAIEGLSPGHLGVSVRADAERLQARLNARLGERENAEKNFKAAAAGWRMLKYPFDLAVSLLEHAEWLVEEQQRAEAEPLLSEARGIFEHLRARPWLERLARVAGATTSTTSASPS